MPSRDPRIWMWAEALDMMDKAERMRRQFFQPGSPGNPGAARRPTWQPPVDLIETAEEYLAALVSEFENQQDEEDAEGAGEGVGEAADEAAEAEAPEAGEDKPQA